MMKYFPGSISGHGGGGSPLAGVNDDGSSAEAVDRRTVTLLRILLAVAALTVTLIDPSGPERFVEISYVLLVAYCLYSTFMFYMVLQGRTPVPVRWAHWIDVAWFATLIALSNGPSSIFFFFFLFPILVASFRWGFAEGLRVTGTCTILFILFAYVAARSTTAEFELNRFLIRPIYLLVFGFMTASWGGREVLFRRRLALFREVGRSSNPRFGVDQALQSLTDKLRAFYDAEFCVLRVEAATPTGKTLWLSTRPGVAGDENDADAGPHRSTDLLSRDFGIVYANGAGKLLGEGFCHIVDPVTLRSVKAETLDCSAIAAAFRANAFVSLPLRRHGSLFGVLFVASRRPSFDRSDLEFLTHLMNQVLPSIENIQLLDRLASQAAGRQRQKLGRDLHDTTVQPYIGLKLGLEALELKHDAGQPIGDDLRRLISLADTSIAEIRGFVRDLKGGTDTQVGSILVTALRQQAAKFREFHGISVDVEADESLRLNDRLGAEVFQIVIEGLSNIRRHSGSKSATVRLSCTEMTLHVRIENGRDGPAPVDEFVPGSIAGRAESLGGRARVERAADRTAVHIEIPL